MTQVQRTPKLEDLEIGRKLTATYRDEKVEAEIVAGEDGQHLVAVGGKTFKSLSAAGSSITGAACRGGVFFGLIQLPKPERKPKTEEPQAEQPTAESEQPKVEDATPEQPKAAKPKSSARAKRGKR